MSNTKEIEDAADRLAELLDKRKAISEDIKDMKRAGEAVGIDMGAVEYLIKMRDKDVDKIAVKNETLRAYGELFGINPFP